MSCDVSVIVPLYNARELVKFTVGSLLNQTLANIEVLLVDDCSTDRSPKFYREVYGHDEILTYIFSKILDSAKKYSADVYPSDTIRLCPA